MNKVSRLVLLKLELRRRSAATSFFVPHCRYHSRLHIHQVVMLMGVDQYRRNATKDLFLLHRLLLVLVAVQVQELGLGQALDLSVVVLYHFDGYNNPFVNHHFRNILVQVFHHSVENKSYHRHNCYGRKKETKLQSVRRWVRRKITKDQQTEATE